MTTELAPTTETRDLGRVAESLIIGGDLSKLTPQQRADYVVAICNDIGINWKTKPFEYITLNGKLTLYARKDATEQLRALHNISLEIIKREQVGDCWLVTARATMPSGRQDESVGAVPMANLKGDALANALMKAETKAKRRVTLSICGLGFLDETELETIPGAVKSSPRYGAAAVLPDETAVDANTGEVKPDVKIKDDETLVAELGGLGFSETVAWKITRYGFEKAGTLATWRDRLLDAVKLDPQKFVERFDTEAK